MNLAKIKEANRKRVLACVTKAGDDGISAAAIVKRTRLCLRTVQTHLRALRTEGLVINHDGIWAAVNF